MWSGMIDCRKIYLFSFSLSVGIISLNFGPAAKKLSFRDETGRKFAKYLDSTPY